MTRKRCDITDPIQVVSQPAGVVEGTALNFETGCTNEITCPHCGYEHTDSYEFFCNSEEDTTVWCGECDKEFAASRIISVTYSTEIIKK